MACDRRYCNATIKLFQKLNIALYFCGFTGFWIEDAQLPVTFKKIFNQFSILIQLVMFMFMVSQPLSFLTQHNLSPKQETDQIVFGVTNPTMFVYAMTLIYHKRSARDVLRRLAVSMKQVYNDEAVEKQMIRKVKFYLTGYVASCWTCIVFYGVSACMQYLKTGITFTTIVTIWPKVEDGSTAAHVARVAIYCVWWVYFNRLSGSYVLILSMFNCLSFQYKNLASYFIQMQSIFDKRRKRSELEEEYESALRTGIRLHIETVWCVQECQKIYNIIFSGQLIMTFTQLVSAMSQMMSIERSFVHMASLVSLISGSMISTGFIMLNAGDVTVEASYLAEAMYACGWHNCSGASSARTRRLLALAMTLAQKPVVFLAFGCVTISYQTYVWIVKTSYSVFSVMY